MGDALLSRIKQAGVVGLLAIISIPQGCGEANTAGGAASPEQPRPVQPEASAVLEPEIAEIVHEALTLLPSDSWLGRRNQASMLEMNREVLRKVHKPEEQKKAGHPPSIRAYLLSLESNLQIMPRPLRIARANVALIDGFYRPEFDPLRLDVFDAGSVEALLWAAVAAGGYPTDERQGARRAFAKLAGRNTEEFDEDDVFDIRCAIYEVALIQSLLGDEPLSREQANDLHQLFSLRFEGWTLPAVTAGIAVQRFGDESEDGSGATFADIERVSAIFDRLTSVTRARLAETLTAEQLERLYDRPGEYASGSLWRRRTWQYAPLYSVDWPTTTMPRVIRRPDPEEIAHFRALPRAW